MFKSTENIEKDVNTKQPSLYNAFCYRKFLILGACIRDFTEKMIANVKQQTNIKLRGVIRKKYLTRFNVWLQALLNILLTHNIH